MNWRWILPSEWINRPCRDTLLGLHRIEAVLPFHILASPFTTLDAHASNRTRSVRAAAGTMWVEDCGFHSLFCISRSQLQDRMSGTQKEITSKCEKISRKLFWKQMGFQNSSNAGSPERRLDLPIAITAGSYEPGSTVSVRTPRTGKAETKTTSEMFPALSSSVHYTCGFSHSASSPKSERSNCYSKPYAPADRTEWYVHHSFYY